MTPLQRRRAEWLARCRFPAASWSKRFAGEMSTRTGLEAVATWREAAALERLCWTYRAQLRALLAKHGEPVLDLVPPCKPPPALPKPAAPRTIRVNAKAAALTEKYRRAMEGRW